LINKTKPDVNGFEVPIPEGLNRYNDQNIMNKAASRGNKRYLFVFPGRLEPCEIRGSRRKIVKEDTKNGVQVKSEVKSEDVKIEKQESNGQIKSESIKIEQKDIVTPVKAKKRWTKPRKKLGTLSDLNTNKPTLYIEYPEGRLKLCGTILYPKNKYMAIKYPQSTNQKVPSSLHCRGVFDNLVVFPEYYWVGTKEENPEEKPLPFPEEIKQKPENFQVSGENTQIKRRSKTSSSRKRRKSRTFDSASDSSDADYQEPIKPIKRAKRTSRKKISYVELDAGDYVDGSSGNEDVLAKYSNNNKAQNDSPVDDYLPTYDD